jgi:Zn-dependent peptidase ImmA (M78 family)
MSSNEQQATRLAQVFRQDHNFGISPIGDVFEMVHTATGVDVFSIDAAQEEHGLTMLDPDTGRRVIVVATTAHPMRQRSSVAHELGHLLRGDLDTAEQAPPGERNPAEICADAFARHLLLPLDAVRTHLAKADAASLADLSDLVQTYEVSPAIAAIQLRTADLITEETCRDWMRRPCRHLALQFGWLNQYDSLADASRRPRAPQTLMKRAVAAYNDGVLDITELATWYGTSEHDLRAELCEPHPAPAAIDDPWDLDAPLFPEHDGHMGS